MRSHLVRTTAALTIAVGLGATLPVVHDRIDAPLPAAAVLSVETGPSPSAGASPAPALDIARTSGTVADRAGANDPNQGRLADPALRGRIPPSPADLLGYVWPLSHGRLTQPFGFSPWGTLVVGGRPFHDGLDLATFCGDRIVAAHDGVVLAAGRRSDAFVGWLGSLDAYRAKLDMEHRWGVLAIIVVIGDGNGYRSLYVHLSQTVVRPGQKVKAGQLIGYEGATGFATGCHLHYSLFSPFETATMELDPKIAKTTLLPAEEIARIDPLLVLPRPSAPTAVSDGGVDQSPVAPADQSIRRDPRERPT